MGIEHDVAIYALKSTNYESEARALSFLMDKENGLYEHEFIPLGNYLCKICLEGKDKHVMNED